MGSFFKKAWRYLGAALTGKFNELADPAVELDMAIEEAQKQARNLRDTAATVIAHQKQTQTQLDRAIENLDKTRAAAKQALLMAEEATDPDRVAKLTQAAEGFANRLVVLEDEVATLEKLLLDATSASDQAKIAVTQNQVMLEQKMTERRELLAKLGQAKMAEQQNAAMESLTAAVGTDVPSMDQVREKIEGRLAKAQAHGDLNANSVQGQMLEVEHATRASQAQAQLSKLRSELGIAGTETEAAAAAQDDIEAEIEAAVKAASEASSEG